MQVRKRFDGDPNQPNKRVTAIQIADSGEIRAISDGQLFVYAQGKWSNQGEAKEPIPAQSIAAPGSIPLQPATCSAKAADGSIWFGTAKGLLHLEGAEWE